MITPKEKAEELVYKFCTFPQLDWTDAKQCALIAVDEIIKFGNGLDIREPMMYWNKVKEEIEKL